MDDRRERILARLRAVLESIAGLSVFRMDFEVTIDTRPAVIIQDGGEEFVGSKNHGGKAAGQYAMRPSVHIFAQKSNQAGTTLNEWRAKIIKEVLLDDVLKALCSTNGVVRYVGCSAEGAFGEAVEADMALDFELTYLFEPMAL
jgi:hypothetical protein